MAMQMKVPERREMGWNTLNNVPIHAMYPKPVLIDDSIYFFPNYMHSEVAYLDNYCNSKYVELEKFSPNCYKYDFNAKKFSIFTKLPSSLTSLYNTVNYNPDKKEIIYIGGTHDVFGTLKMNNNCDEEKEEEFVWNLDNNFKGRYETTGPLPASIYIDGKFHMIGGHNSYYHEIYDVKQNRMKPIFKFEYRLKDRSLIYCQRLKSLIMFGGCRWTEDFKQSVRFRYIDEFLICNNPNDFNNIKWEIKKEWRLPYLMMGFGYLLINDSQILIFGGRKSGGTFIDECWMFDLIKNKWWKSKLKIPIPGKYHAILTNNNCVELFQYGHPSKSNGAHFNILLSTLLNSMQSIDKLPKREEYGILKQDKQNEKVYTMNKNKYTKVSFNELANEVLNNKDLSKNQRKKMLKKLKKKQAKYNKPFVPHKDIIEQNQNSNPVKKGKMVSDLDIIYNDDNIDNNYNNNNNKSDSNRIPTIYGIFGAVAIFGAIMFYYNKNGSRINNK